jgi:hypothetical protein
MPDNERAERDLWQDEVPLEDRLEQAQAAAPEPQRAPLPSRSDVPEADALEQAEEVEPGPLRGRPASGFEVPEADATDQAAEIPIDEEFHQR